MSKARKLFISCIRVALPFQSETKLAARARRPIHIAAALSCHGLIALVSPSILAPPPQPCSSRTSLERPSGMYPTTPCTCSLITPPRSTSYQRLNATFHLQAPRHFFNRIHGRCAYNTPHSPPFCSTHAIERPCVKRPHCESRCDSISLGVVRRSIVVI